MSDPRVEVKLPLLGLAAERDESGTALERLSEDEDAFVRARAKQRLAQRTSTTETG